MKKTTIGSLVWAALVAVPIGWSIGRLVDAWSGALPPIPWVLPFLLVFLGVCMFAGARVVKQWIEERRFDRRLDPLRIARALALAKATEYFGALVAGAYAGLGVLALTMLDSPMGRGRSLLSAAVVVCAVAMTVGAFRLERSCLVPHDDADEDGWGGGNGGHA